MIACIFRSGAGFNIKMDQSSEIANKVIIILDSYAICSILYIQYVAILWKAVEHQTSLAMELTPAGDLMINKDRAKIFMKFPRIFSENITVPTGA